MLIGTNPRVEAAVLNGRIRKRWREGGLLVGVIGPKADLGYSYEHLGDGPQALEQFVTHQPAQSERPMFIVGPGAYARPDGAAIMSMAAKAAQALGVVKDGLERFCGPACDGGARHRAGSRLRAGRRAATVPQTLLAAQLT